MHIKIEAYPTKSAANARAQVLGAGGHGFNITVTEYRDATWLNATLKNNTNKYPDTAFNSDATPIWVLIAIYS